MLSWAEKEMSTLDLGDVRRNGRVTRILDTLASHPGSSVPHACKDKAAMNATYYSWNSPHVTPAGVLAAHRDATVERLRSLPLVLVPNDTTNLDYTSHDSVEDLGHLDNKTRFGLKVHTAIAVSPEGAMLGTLHQDVWSRDRSEVGKFKTRRKRDIEDKESRKWLDTLDAVQVAIPDTTTAVVIGDREADIYQLFVHPRDAHVELLVRSAWNRRIAESDYLHDAVRKVLPCGKLTIEVPRADGRQARKATLILRYADVSILPPSHMPRKLGFKPAEVCIVLAEEESPPAGAQPVCWLMLTTLKVTGAGDAAQCVNFYSRRWLIERFHFVLKSGCRIEQLQLKTIDALESALATFDVVAWRLMYLTYQARLTPNAPCTVVFEQAEWEALCIRTSKKPEPPKKPPTLREAILLVAKLGGFLGRKSDGEPGVKTIWQGLMAFHECVEMYAAMREIRPPRLASQTCRER